MPRYDFRNKVTGEIFEKMMKIAEREQFLKDNPDLEQVLLSPPQVNGDPIGSNQHGKAFREVLNKIHQKTPGSQLNKNAEI